MLFLLVLSLLELEEAFDPGNEDFRGESPAAFEIERDRLDVASLARWLRGDRYRGLVVMVGGLEPDEREEVFHFCRDLGAPLVVEATSGLREALGGLAIHDADRVLRAKPPGKILRLGDVPSGRFWRDLEDLTKTSVWSVCRNGLPGLARASTVTRGRVDRVLRALGDIDPDDDALDLFDGASARAARVDELLECYPDSEPGLIRAVSHYACIAGGLFLGNSLPIREWNLFAQWARPVTEVRANRGVNGIDGQTSSWLGWSADQANSWALLGDLTALYDAAAPFVLDQVETAGRVLAVINNRGGRIFERLPRLRAMNSRAAECMTNPHGANLAGFATLWGMKHARVATLDDFDRFDPDTGTTLLEIAPDPDQTAAFWRDWDAITV